MDFRRFLTCATCAVALTVVPLSALQKAPASGKATATKPATGKPDMLPIQVLLDRAGYSPGEVDGVGGPNTDHAIAAYERDKNVKIADALTGADAATISYTITPEDAATPFTPDIPEDMMEKARLKKLEYSSLLEMLAERFHASPALL